MLSARDKCYLWLRTHRLIFFQHWSLCNNNQQPFLFSIPTDLLRKIQLKTLHISASHPIQNRPQSPPPLYVQSFISQAAMTRYLH